MGVSVDTGGKAGKKPVTADLNLVPYIDLLTCMVAFLLITAVWTQLARLEARQRGQGQAGEETPPGTETAAAGPAKTETADMFNASENIDYLDIPSFLRIQAD